MIFDFGFSIAFDPSAGQPGQPAGSFLLALEIFAVPVGLALSLPFCTSNLRESAQRGFWGYGAAVITGATIGFFVGATLGLFVGGWIGTPADAVFFALVGGAHAAVMYGIPASLLVLFWMSFRDSGVWSDVFGRNALVPPALAFLPLIFMALWHFILWNVLVD